MSTSLALKDAQKLVLLAQRLPPTRQAGNAQAATLAAIEHLAYIQIDTIAVVQRAHHHTLWNRNPRYKPEHLEQLLREKKIFEYWSHAAAYLPMQDYRFSLPRKLVIADREQQHWYVRDEKLMQSVLHRITEEGPLMAKDFDDSKLATGHWKSKPTKRALESLYMEGKLMVPKRINFHKVYDLSERVLPEDLNTSVPSPEEYARFLVRRYLQANGLGQPAHMSYLLKNIKGKINTALQQMQEDGEVISLEVDGQEYFANTDVHSLLRKPLARHQLKILSPFDNLLIQRKRIQNLFNFDYLIECYAPEAKRKYGYFCLPILWQGNLCARMDCKADKKTATLQILRLHLEPSIADTEGFTAALAKELRHFMQFNHCIRISLEEVAGKIKTPLSTALADL